ncbi:MAG: prepilin-type N-terminal cleavage/methylation domain-containing protein [Candidatus Krumholzibacteriia bacterium]
MDSSRSPACSPPNAARSSRGAARQSRNPPGLSCRATCRRTTASSRRPNRAGFTLIELLAALLIIGVLIAFAVANFLEFQGRARYAACVTNKRNMLEASLFYIMETLPGTATFSCDLLIAEGRMPAKTGKCPSGEGGDFSDYTIEITNNAPTSITCLIEPVAHFWDLP